jgi:hypothetical protein
LAAFQLGIIVGTEKSCEYVTMATGSGCALRISVVSEGVMAVEQRAGMLRRVVERRRDLE